MTVLDLKDAYYHIPLRKEDRPKTAFVTPTGHYQFTMMPFGLVNAPRTWQRYIQFVIRDQLNKTAIAYFDDIVVYTSGSIDDHIRAVDKLLTTLEAHNLRSKPSKCHFAYTRIRFLGHII
jgi:putative transposase